MSRLAAAGASETALSPSEAAEMKEHLVFLRRYKDVLRLKLNAVEDLLVNGQREPVDRGTCRHLLGKLDRTVVEQALEREPLRSDASQRARMLAGAIRLTADVGVLLAYLETLRHVRSRVEAAQAFGEVVRRIDFASLSAARLGRLLQVLLDTFAQDERVPVLLGVLAAPTFAQALDAALPALPPPVVEVVAPLRAVHRRLAASGGDDSPALLATGLEQILGVPDPVLQGYPEPMRIGLLDLALGPTIAPALADRAAGVLLPSLPRGGRTYARLALRYGARLLARRADDRARAVLEELRRAQPGERTAERWVRALGARRLGRVALEAEPLGRGRLAPALWLDAQRPVWLRTAAGPEAERLAAEARLHAELALPGLAALVESGVAHGIPYLAVAGAGRLLTPEMAQALDAPGALALAAAAGRVLHALALAGISLPDAALERFLHAPPAVLTLADLDGARRVDPATAAGLHATLAAALARTLLAPDTAARLPPPVVETLEQALAAPAALAGLIGVLERAGLHAARR